MDPDCITVATTELTLDAENVIFASLELNDGFTLVVMTVNIPLPEPDEGPGMGIEGLSLYDEMQHDRRNFQVHR